MNFQEYSHTTCDNCGDSILENNKNSDNFRIYKRGIRRLTISGKKFVLCPKCVKKKRKKLR